MLELKWEGNPAEIIHGAVRETSKALAEEVEFIQPIGESRILVFDYPQQVADILLMVMIRKFYNLLSGEKGNISIEVKENSTTLKIVLEKGEKINVHLNRRV